MPWFPMYPQDYDADTGDLDLERDGLYSRMIRRAWYMSPDGCSLPAGMPELARTLGIPQRTLIRLSSVISRFWIVEGDRLISIRLRRESEKAGNKSKSQSVRAKRGWSSLNRGASSGHSPGIRGASSGQSPSDAIQIHRESKTSLPPPLRQGQAPALGAPPPAPTPPDRRPGMDSLRAGETPPEETNP